MMHNESARRAALGVVINHHRYGEQKNATAVTTTAPRADSI
jgi:hypothetical protein